MEYHEISWRPHLILITDHWLCIFVILFSINVSEQLNRTEWLRGSSYYTVKILFNSFELYCYLGIQKLFSEYIRVDMHLIPRNVTAFEKAEYKINKVWYMQNSSVKNLVKKSIIKVILHSFSQIFAMKMHCILLGAVKGTLHEACITFFRTTFSLCIVLLTKICRW